MKFLIPIDYSNSERPTVLGRDLHDILEVKSHYKDWFPRMCEYGFEEGSDYVKFRSKKTETPDEPNLGGRPAVDHQLTLIAQQLSDKLGEKYTAKRVNLMLAERGLQYKDSSGWKLTDSGKHFGAMYPYERNGHTGYQLRWNQSVVTTLLNN